MASTVRRAAPSACSPAPAATFTSTIRCGAHPTCTSSPSTCSVSCRSASRSGPVTWAAAPNASTSVGRVKPRSTSTRSIRRINRSGRRCSSSCPIRSSAIAAFGAFSTPSSIARGQLLRPYPQFGNVFAHQVSAGRSRYHSLTVDGQRRLRGGWGADVNYTWSRLDDNVVGEFNFFSDRGVLSQIVLNNYDLDCRVRPVRWPMSASPQRHDHRRPAVRRGTSLAQRAWTCARPGWRLGRHAGRLPPERLPDSRRPVEQQLQPARQQPAPQRGARRRSGGLKRRAVRRVLQLRRVAESGGVVGGTAVHVRQRAARRSEVPHAVAQHVESGGAEGGGRRYARR